MKYSDKVCAVGGFTKNTLVSLKKEFENKEEKRKIIVLTVTTNGKQEIYQEKEALVIRCFNRNQPQSYLFLLRYLLKFNRVKDLLVEFEFASFGNTLTTGLFPIVLWFGKILGKNINLVLHQVIFDLNELSGHIGFKKSSLKSLLFEKLLKIFYWLLCVPAKKIIVLEQEFKKRLSKIISKRKILVIPHGVDTKLKAMAKNLARKKLGIKKNEKVILYFGYLTWYKGIDWLTKQIKNSKLIIAGGPSFTQKNKAHYQRFLKGVYQAVEKADNICLTGFVKEKDISLYFSATDLVILPYRAFISSSGPLSLALSFAKPFILSKPLEKILETDDFKKGLKEAKINGKDFIFDFNRESLIEKLKKANFDKLTKFSQIMREKRSFENLSLSYVKIL